MKLISQYNKYYLPLLIIIFFICSILNYFLVKNILKEEVDESLIAASRKIKSYISDNNKIPETNVFTKEIIAFEKINTPICDTGFSNLQIKLSAKGKLHQSRKFTFVVSNNQQLYKASIASPIEGIGDLTKTILMITMITIFAIIVISILANRVILSKLWLPFYESLHVLNGFKIDNPVPLVFPKTNINEFNFMIGSLQASTQKETETYKSLKEFTENASHEIQTPLAIIRSKLDILIQQDNFIETGSETSRSLYCAIDKLSKLSKSLLLIAKIDNHGFENKTCINFKPKIEDKLDQFQELWQMNDISITSSLLNATILANENLMDILLNNLLSNATKHNILTGNIHIATDQNFLSVNNTGAALALDKLKIFNRFYKQEQHSESNGLGLSIVKQICDKSGIDISYEFDNNNHCFILTW